MFKTFNKKITESDGKRLFLATWPGENIKPEVWTMKSVKEDFGKSQMIMNMVLALNNYDELCYQEGNLVLQRIPSYINLSKIKYRL